MLKYLFVLSLFVAQNAQAQQRTASPGSLWGEVAYRQEIKMRSTAIAVDTLKFNRTQSIFYWNLYSTSNDGVQEVLKEHPNATVKTLHGGVGNGQVTLFDMEKDSLFSRMNKPYIGKLLYLKEKAPPINWSIGDSTKNVGNYTVKNATTHFRGRDYTAWFTTEIPVPFGPWKLHGLPGLILQAYDQSGHVYFSATDIALSNVGPIPIGSIPQNGKEEVITFKQYKEITDHFKRYIKRDMLKTVRPYVSKEDFANMKVELPPVELMETFKANGDQ